MTDRIRHLTVILDRDMREDDVQVVVEAIKMIKYVASVHLGDPVSGEDWIARETVRLEVQKDLFKSISEILNPQRSRNERY